jgi:hypothetical protein
MSLRVTRSSLLVGAVGSAALSGAFYYLAAFWPGNVAVFAALATLGAALVGSTSHFRLLQQLDKAWAALPPLPEVRRINRYFVVFLVLTLVGVPLGMSGYLFEPNSAIRAGARFAGLGVLVACMVFGTLNRLHQLAVLHRLRPDLCP